MSVNVNVISVFYLKVIDSIFKLLHFAVKQKILIKLYCFQCNPLEYKETDEICTKQDNTSEEEENLSNKKKKSEFIKYREKLELEKLEKKLKALQGQRHVGDNYIVISFHC